MKILRRLFGEKRLIHSLDHIAIEVSDMNRSVEFYSGILGFDVLLDGRSGGGKKKTFLGVELKSMIALSENKNRISNKTGYVEGVNHVAFTVSDFERARKLLTDNQVEIVEDKIGDNGITRVCHFLDPDGLELEICEELEQEVPPY